MDDDGGNDGSGGGATAFVTGAIGNVVKKNF